jgi:hypothetical protein
MKFKLCIVLAILMSLQSCCLKKGEETNRISYSVEDKAKIPYADNQTIDMITDEGFQFQLNTAIDRGFNSDQEHCEDYTSYEYYRVYLTSNLPALNIGLSLTSFYNAVDDTEFTGVTIDVNRLLFNYDSELPLEILEVNGTTYTDVYKYTSNIADEPISEVWFNESNGVLRINYLNGDYAQINQ